MGLDLNPLDSIHSDEQFFGATKSFAAECLCGDCVAKRTGDRLSRAELIARVAYEMSVEVSAKESPGPRTAEQMRQHWQVVRAAKRRQSAGKWR